MTSSMQIPAGLIDGSPSLDTQPSESHPTGIMPYDEVCRTLVRPAYVRAGLAYDLADESRPRKRSERLAACRSGAWFVVHTETREVRVRSEYCGLRWCPMCQKLKRHIITENVAEWIQKQNQVRLITLTLKHSHNDLTPQINHLMESWSRLRRHKAWREHCTGGIFFLQITRNAEKGEWHPHLHILATGSYLAHGTLKVLWAQASRGSSICDIRKAYKPSECVKYVARYATCPADLCAMGLSEAVEVILACDGRKVAGTFGSARGCRLSYKKPEGPDQFKLVCSFMHGQIGATHDESYRELWQCWMNKTPLPITWCAVDEVDMTATPPPESIEEPIRYLWDSA